VKFDEKDKASILLSSLHGHDHIVTTMLYKKETFFLEVTTTLLSSKIKKKPIQEEQEGSGLAVTRRKERGEGKEGSGSSNACHFCHRECHWKKDFMHRHEWLKKKRKAAETDIVISDVDTEVLTDSIDNTSSNKSWILDSDSIIHVCFHKDMFNSLIAKEERAVKMVDGSACKIIGTGTVNVTRRDGMVRALKVVWYVSEARYNLIFWGCSMNKDTRSKCNKAS